MEYYKVKQTKQADLWGAAGRVKNGIFLLLSVLYISSHKPERGSKIPEMCQYNLYITILDVNYQT